MATAGPLVFNSWFQIVQDTDIRKCWKENRIAPEKNSVPNMWKQCYQTRDFKGLLQKNKMQGGERMDSGDKMKGKQNRLAGGKKLPGNKG